MAIMVFAEPPASAAWEHRDARTGFEVLRTARRDGGWTLRGTTTAVENGTPWVVEYAIEVDGDWHTRSARVRHPLGGRPLALDKAPDGRWLVDDRHDPRLDGCVDVDLESSAMTNALPVHRLRLDVDETADAPAVYVRAADLTVDRLEQSYARLPDTTGRQCYGYAAPAFDFTARLVYDESGFVLDYPGLAVRRA
ncbi:putative glycolipid-binding domain-containing protein [Actinomadura sp. 9N215]|uniref:putative glycolipid-binding domain-containing protein n=1 Tax=Actinomadura sp. 9N215 TaxID=3375150 RepID=UPI003792FC60